MGAWLQLFRVALFPSILWDVAAGVLLAGLALDASILPSMGIAVLLYHAGMVLNDFADRKEDAQHRSLRPIPAGRIRPATALATGLGMIAAACGLAAALLPTDGLVLTLAIAAVVLVYDLGGSALRRPLGPALLALARMGSLNLGLAAQPDWISHIRQSTLAPMFAYGLWYLFTTRLSAGEEEGATGMRGLQYTFGVALAPVLLFVPETPHWSFVPAWILVAAWLLQPALRDRNEFWAPERVQAAVRRALSGAPLCLGIALLAADQPVAAAAAPAVTLTVSFLARSFAPE